MIRRRSSSLALAARDGASITGGAPAALRDPSRGFRNLGDFARAVKGAGASFTNPGDDRLLPLAAAPGTVGSEQSGADGGFAVPPQYAADVSDLLAEYSLLDLFDLVPTATNSAVFPKDETTPWGNTGIRAAWQVEAAALGQIKPALGATVMRLAKLAALVPVSDELLADAPALDAYLGRAAAEAIGWKASDAFINGLGNGTPEGIAKCGALVVVAKDAGQATQTLSATNIGNMLSRLLPGSYARAVWLADESLVPVLTSIGATQSGFPITFSAEDSVIPGTKIGTLGKLAGRPIVVTQHCASFSSQGDLLLVDPAAYRVLVKDTGIAQALSLHLFFDADAACFRFTFRVDGQSKYFAPVQPPKGSATLSPFVALGAR